jgi:hypothetical protein
MKKDILQQTLKKFRRPYGNTKSLVIKKMEIKSALRIHLMPVKMNIIKNTTINKCCQGYGEKGILTYCLWEFKSVQPLSKTVWRLLKKSKNRTTI